MPQDQQNKEQEFYNKFKSQLESAQQFPGVYTFKFIVKKSDNTLPLVKALFDPKEAVMKLRPSSKGTYDSVTISLEMPSADEVIEKYRTVAKIPGVMLL